MNTMPEDGPMDGGGTIIGSNRQSRSREQRPRERLDEYADVFGRKCMEHIFQHVLEKLSHAKHGINSVKLRGRT